MMHGIISTNAQQSAHHIALIRSLPIFTGFTDHGAQLLLQAGRIEDYPVGCVLFKEEEAPDSVLVLLDGRMLVYVERGGHEVALTESCPGAILGELAVLGQMPRAASVRTIQPSTVLRWTDQAFRRLLLGNSSLSERIFAASVKMLIEKEKALIEALVRAERRGG